MNREYFSGKRKKGATIVRKNIRKNRIFTLRSRAEKYFPENGYIQYPYIYIYIYSKIYRFVIETWTPLPPPLSVHDLLFRPAFAAGSFYAITLPTLGGKMAERVEEGRRHIASKARVKSGAAVVCPSRIVMHFLYERSVATIQTASSGRRY